jgi:2-desacetyl-2-hydroxyethyl bacteriochlorophyllide A dehydrogenase
MSKETFMTAIQSSAILITAKFQATLGTHTLPEPEKGEVLIRSHLTAISPGTEMRCYAGLESNSDIFPFVPGYCLVGVVERKGPDVSLPVGTRVLAGGTRKSNLRLQWGGHTEWAVASESELLPIPDGVPFAAAVLAPLAAISHHGAVQSKPEKGEKVAVIGLGPIGMFSALIHHGLGVETVGIDTLPLRRELASSLGIPCFASIPEALAACPKGFNIVVDGSGVPAVLPEAIKLITELPWDGGTYPASRLILQGSYAGDGAPIPYRELFMKEIRILVPRNHVKDDRRAVLQMMKEGKLPAEKLLSTIQPPANAQAVYIAIKDRTEPWMTAAFQWSK